MTGSSGYVGSWIVRQLLADGHAVHATVRDPDDDAKVAHLKRLAAQHPGRLALFSADLMAPGSFRRAFEGCKTVVHAASPFSLSAQADVQRELFDTATTGTRNVLDDVNASHEVRRVVLTSSVAAIYGDAAECAARGGTLTEEHWNSTSSRTHMPYPYSKVVAERLAWSMAREQSRWRLVTINPGFVIGPSLSSRSDATSVSFLIDMLSGALARGVWDFTTPWVDVRDVAEAHVRAAFDPDAEGRYAVSAGEHSLMQIGDWIASEYGGAFSPPRRVFPKWLVWSIAPTIGHTRHYVRENIGWPVRFDVRRSRALLPRGYRPLLQSVRDHVAQLVEDGLVAPRDAPRAQS